MEAKMNNFSQSIHNNALAFNEAFMNATQTFVDHLNEEDNLYVMVDQARFVATVIVLMWFVMNVCACCSDPCGDRIKRRLKSVETELSEALNTIADLDEENDKLKDDLAKARLEIIEIESRYLSCRQAAQRFIDTPIVVPNAKRQRMDSE